jgi:hypothetical protein
MNGGIFSFTGSISASASPCAARAIARACLRVCARMVRRRRHQAVAELDDWILHDIGVIRERDFDVALEAGRREAAQQFWRP